MNVTLKDIARALNLATSTVSMALNDNPSISSKTRRRVKTLAKKLDYRPNIIARAMVKKKTHLIGLIITDIMSSFFPQIIQGIEDTVGQEFYSIILCATNDELDKETEYARLLRQKRVDGLIIEPVLGSGNLPLWQELKEKKVPFVTILRQLPVDGIVYVGVDNFRGGYLAANHLITLGHRVIGHLAGPPGLQISKDRKAGYLKALKDRSIDAYGQLILGCDFSREAGYQQMKRMLRLQPRPTAVFVCSDIVAIGAIDAVLQAGLNVPEDIAIVGFDDLFFSSFTAIPLTSISQPKYELGVLAANKLLTLISNKKTKGEILAPSLVVRQSCGAKLARLSRNRRRVAL